MTEGWLLQTSLHNWTNVVKNVSTSTMRRRQCETGLYSRIAVKKPLLRKQNNVKGLQWGKVHKDWTIEQWNKVLWTDELKVEILGSDWSFSMQWRVCERAAPPLYDNNRKAWRGLNYDVEDFFQLYNWDRMRLQHTVASCDPTLNVACQGPVLTQDIDLKPISKIYQRYIKSKEEQCVLQLMSWPAQSTDLNPI